MNRPSITSLDPAIAVLATCLVLTNENYQRLLNQPESFAFCREAGRSVRHLSERYSQVLQVALSDQSAQEDEVEFLDDEDALTEDDLEREQG